MVKKFFNLLNKEFHGLTEAALLLGLFSFLSQILGLIRDRSLASMVGAGPVLDVYYAAFRIPDFLYISIASLASITVLMPFLMDKIKKEDKTVAKKFMNNIFTVYLLFMVLSSVLIAIFMPRLVNLIAPGFSADQVSTLVLTSRIMLISPIFIGLSNLVGTVTQLFRNFLIFSLSPVFYNIGILLGIYFLYPRFGVYGLSLGVILGALMHFAIQIPVLIKNGFLPKLIYKINWKEIWEVVKISAPRTLTLSCNSLAFITLIAMASNLKEGSISLFTFAYNLQSVPVGIIGISYSVAAFPVLVRYFSEKNIESFVGQITTAMKQIIFWSLPIIALFVVLRAQIVRVVLGANAFSWADTRITAAAVAIFVLSLVTQGLVLLLVRGYYASGNTKKPLISSLISSFSIIFFAKIFSYLFENNQYFVSLIEKVLRVENVSGTAMLALPLAFSIGSILNLIILWFMFSSDFCLGKKYKIWVTFFESLAGAFVMGFVSYFALGVLDGVFDLTTGWGIFSQGLFSGLIGICSGLVLMYLLGNKELEDLVSAVKNKFWKKKIIAPEQSDL